MHADKEPEPLNLGVPVVNFPRANAILARAQALLWVRDCILLGFQNKSTYFDQKLRAFRNLGYAFNMHTSQVR